MAEIFGGLGMNSEAWMQNIQDQVSATAKDELSYVKLNLVTSFDAKTIIKVDLL